MEQVEAPMCGFCGNESRTGEQLSIEHKGIPPVPVCKTCLVRPTEQLERMYWRQSMKQKTRPQ